jgi:5,10-methylenetetrahydromethanopterin reductase
MPVTLSCAFATSMSTPEQVVVADSLGYERAWFYDSPALYPDVWVTLARAAERTSTIGLGRACSSRRSGIR